MLMIARIEVAEGVFIDARAVPVALIGLVEGGPAGLLAGVVAAIYRWSLGGSGAAAGVAGLLAVGAAGALAHEWARRDGPAGPRHAFALGGAVYLTTFASFGLLGPRGLELFSRVWVHYLVAYVLGTGLVARLLRDVVERAQLATAHERFRALIDEASDAIRILDADTLTILEVNRADCELSGYSRAQLLGRDVRDFWPTDAELRRRYQAVSDEARARGVARASGLPYVTGAGSAISIDSTRRIVEYQGRRYEVIVVRDASERVAAEAARLEAGELRAVTLLAGAAAHEINNPLAVVVGSLGLLARTLPQEGQERKWLDQALAAGQRIQEIVARMTRIIRIERAPAHGALPPMLDIKKSSEPN
ncbi:MAG: PAS domain S-box protein [Candidatus Rokubacteria bacterium]|nr:PAS domain S-box protein [Candidatus Rokubacteria bacterium]